MIQGLQFILGLEKALDDIKTKKLTKIGELVSFKRNIDKVTKTFCQYYDVEFTSKLYISHGKLKYELSFTAEDDVFYPQCKQKIEHIKEFDVLQLEEKQIDTTSVAPKKIETADSPSTATKEDDINQKCCYFCKKWCSSRNTGKSKLIEASCPIAQRKTKQKEYCGNFRHI